MEVSECNEPDASARTSVDDGVLGNNTVLGRISFDNLELHGPHPTTNKESVSLADRPVC